MEASSSSSPSSTGVSKSSADPLQVSRRILFRIKLQSASAGCPLSFDLMEMVGEMGTGIKSIPSSASQTMDFFLDPNCDDIRCGAMTSVDVCSSQGVNLGYDLIPLI